MLHGFYISHFRNFGDTPHLVGPLGKISVFIGGNNAGKSNILRYVRDIISPLYNNQRDRPAEAIGINQSRFSSTPQSAVKVLVKVTDETIASAFGSENSNLNASFLDFYRSLPGSVGSEYTAVPILKSQSSSNERIATAELDSEGVGEGVAKQIWSTGGQSGGGFQQHWYPFTLQKLFDAQRTNVDCVYVPAFRQLDTRLERFSHEYRHVAQSEHVIDELASFAYPTYEDQQKKQSFEKLRSFIAEIVGNPDVRVEIPHDRSTINIDLDGQVLPVEALGSGIHELVMLASRVVLNEGKIILLEEPEVHMHPEFQRKFMSFIRDKIDSQFFITTHSSVVIDTDGVAVFGVSKKDGQGYVAPLLSDQSRREMCRELGYRASDLLQANSIVWVEGPSDRIYLKHWLNAAAPELREGIEFSIMFYGGKMLSHLSGEDDAELQDFIALLPINRYGNYILE